MAPTSEYECLRYLQSAERSLRVPQGLLMAISLAESGRVGEDGRLASWPWTINVNGRGQYFESKDEAVAATRKLLDSGQRSIDVGCMQVNLRYHPDAFATVEAAFDPATNVTYGAQYLASLHQVQGSWSKAVERYHSSDDGRREQYRERVIELWNTEVRTLVMNTVSEENTDTPYHRAVRAFVGAQYEDALGHYQSIVEGNANDRIGLLGVAMSYDELGREMEAMQAYAKYLAVEPSNESVRTMLIQKASAKAPDAARSDLEAFVKAGVNEPDLLAALSEVANTSGDTNAAFTYASDAARAAPSVPAYQLNAGVLADKLNRTAAAVQFYERFLATIERYSIPLDAPIDNVRQRVKFLRARL